LLKQRIENRFVAVKSKPKAGLPAMRDRGPWKRDSNPFVAAHCVERGGNRSRHAIRSSKPFHLRPPPSVE
jgi:hypothetical protein